MLTRAAPSVSTLYADALGAFLAEQGLPRDAGAAPPGPRLCGSAFAGLMTGGARELGDPALGLRFGTRVGAAGFGMLGIAAASAPTLRDAIGHLTELESITSTLGRARVLRRGQRVHLVWQPAQTVAPAVIEGILAGWVSFGRYLLGGQAEVAHVSLRHSRIAQLAEYEDAFACPLRFGTCCYGVTIATELLDATPRFADARLNAALGTWLGHCARTSARDGAVVTRAVGALFASSVPLAEADEARTAAALGLAPRALQRALRREGASFRQLLGAARAQQALIGVLRGDAPLAQLGAAVGFEEQSSLCRAFRGWTGYPPLVFRQRMAQVFRPLRLAQEPSGAGPHA
ncbi:helix-turn-helix domain-containing protein [Massilia sp. CCM 8695]|uniref:Helix-turn-helix domain-containing protein n=1 Tax=Massilia frigida TaxID=2609281 RepID=A0ABX0NHA9_9BURK|nr:AraC family transcriptional regulator [Massilia frigida]NHZ82432.1 helix-turn-helix domain-containing protein [Massilia frigida]